MMSIRKGYSDGPQGQIHWRMLNAAREMGLSDLFCFSPAPFGSIAYTTLMPHLAKERRVIAVDYPGQSGSDGDDIEPRIEDYAVSMLAVIADLSDGRPVHVLGFHSGCLVAIEAKLRAHSEIDHVILIDVPAFDAETRETYLPLTGAPFELSSEIDSLQKAWDMAVTKRLETQSLARSLAMFADTVGNGPRMNATFHAAFTYDVDSKLAALDGTSTIIATQSALLEPSRRAASLIPSCRLIEALDIQRSVLDEHAEATAHLINDALS